MVELKMCSNTVYIVVNISIRVEWRERENIIFETYVPSAGQLNGNIITVFAISYLLTSPRLIESSLNYPIDIIGI